MITLDADTELPRDAARKLVATMAHPLNRPVLDARRTARRARARRHAAARRDARRRARGGTRSRASASAPAGIDPYTTAVSDVYQDLFGEGSFVGKGIYDVDAFKAALGGRVPENRLLSHDLFEGIFARTRARDRHRGARRAAHVATSGAPRAFTAGSAATGSWSLVALRPRCADLRVLDAWKIIDNLRRSLLAPAIVRARASSASSSRRSSPRS